jgi:integrase
MRRKKGRLAMNARKQGGVLVRERKLGRIYALRFRAYGARQYLTLGCEHGGWNLDKASVELQNVLADVRRGLWVPPKKRRGASERAERAEAQPFGPFAMDLTESRVGQVAEKTTKHERWALGHLVPFFGDWVLNEIDVEGVDEYRAFKAKESEARARAIERGKPKRNDHGQILRPLSAGSTNRTIDYLQWVLSIAIEYGRFGITENTAEGKRRRLRQKRPAPVYIDSAAQVEALLRAAAELDRDPHYELAEREVIVATFLFAGPRAHELGNLLWRDVDLAGARILIGRSKTEAGLREIKILPILCNILATYKALVYRGDPDALVFPTLAGARRDPDNLRARVLGPTIERADDLLESRGQVPLPRGLTTHKLRHAFASILVALGEDPISVMTQIGHTDPKFTLRVYTHMMSLDPDDRGRLKALVRGEQVIARPAPLPRPVDLAEYEAPIIAALAERGGRAPRREILVAVGEAMARRHGAADLEELPSGGPRWQPRLSKARALLVERGWLEETAWRGDWGLTECGWGKARRDRVRGERPRVEVAETELAVAV